MRFVSYNRFADLSCLVKNDAASDIATSLLTSTHQRVLLMMDNYSFTKCCFIDGEIKSSTTCNESLLANVLQHVLVSHASLQMNHPLLIYATAHCVGSLRRGFLHFSAIHFFMVFAFCQLTSP